HFLPLLPNEMMHSLRFTSVLVEISFYKNYICIISILATCHKMKQRGSNDDALNTNDNASDQTTMQRARTTKPQANPRCTDKEPIKLKKAYLMRDKLFNVEFIDLLYS